MTELTKALFDGRVGEVFQLSVQGAEPVSLVLTAIDSFNELVVQQARDIGLREPFSLLFHGPLEPALPQCMYKLSHEQVGIADVFLVPVERDEQGLYYEAVFN